MVHVITKAIKYMFKIYPIFARNFLMVFIIGNWKTRKCYTGGFNTYLYAKWQR